MNIFDISVKTRTNEDFNLGTLKGKVLLIVNTATGCGFTPQYEGLENLYKKYHEQGLEILDFPCDQFGHQAPGSDDEIHEFCSLKYNTSFDQFKKIEVNGENEDPLFTFLKAQKGFEGFSLKGKILIPIVSKMDKNWKTSSNIKWNFTKFLVDKDGNVTDRFESTVEPSKIEERIKTLL
ncbi:MAG: glutathione peroxidase [Lachnospiraceae bacterium]|nr:glutathione peroxidase [Lachnospiraceae bacterium]